MDKLFITISGICALIASALCIYRYFSTINSSYVEIVCSVAFITCAIIAFKTRKYCSNG